MYATYEHKTSFWHMVSNPVLAEQEQSAFNKKKNDNRRNDLIEDIDSRRYNSLEAQINPEDKLMNLTITESENSEFDAKQMLDPHFVEQKYQYKLLLEQNNRFQHIICSVVQDKKSNKYQTFCRGEALTIVENCTDFWNGTAIVPFSEHSRRKIKELLQQWATVSFDSVGFSYKPVTPDVQHMLVNHLENGTAFNKELAKS